MEEKKLEFVRNLYSKYGVEVDDNGLKQAKMMFEGDFDYALNKFYKQFNIDKQITPEISYSLKKDYGFLQPEQPQKEENYFGGAIGRAIKAVEDAPVVGSVADFVDDMGRAIGAGSKQAGLVTPSNSLFLSGKDASSEQIKNYINAAKEMERYTPSDEMMEFNRIYQEEGGVWGVLKGLALNPSVLPEIMISSTRAMLNSSSATAAGTVAGGAAAGGAVFGGAGAIPAAIGSIPFAVGSAGAVLESGLTFSELLKEEIDKRGIEFNEENVRKILNEEDTLNSIRAKAAARGATIGIIDGLTGRLGGKVGAKIARSATSKAVPKGLAAGAGVEMIGGSVGEAAGRSVAGQEMDTAEILLEGIAEGPMSAINVGAEMLKKQTKITANGKPISVSQLENILKNSNAEEIKNMNISIENDSKNYAESVKKAIEEKSKEKVKFESKAKVDRVNEVSDPISDSQFSSDLDSVINQFIEEKANSKAKEESGNANVETDAATASPSAPADSLRLPFISIQDIIDLTQTQEEVVDTDTEGGIETDVEEDRPVGAIGIEAPGRSEQVTEQQIEEESDAVQEQETSGLPVQSEAAVSEKVEEGEPQTELEESAQEEVIPEQETPLQQLEETPQIEKLKLDEQKAETTDGESGKARSKKSPEVRVEAPKKEDGRASRTTRINKIVSETKNKLNKYKSVLDRGNVTRDELRALQNAPLTIDRYISERGIKEGEGLEDLIEAKAEFERMALEADKSRKPKKFEGSNYTEEFVNEAVKKVPGSSKGREAAPYIDDETKNLSAIFEDEPSKIYAYNDSDGKWYLEENLPNKANSKYAQDVINKSSNMGRTPNAKQVDSFIDSLSKVDRARLTLEEIAKFDKAVLSAIDRIISVFSTGKSSQREFFYDAAKRIKSNISPETRSYENAIRALDSAETSAREVDEISSKKKESKEAARAERESRTEEQKAEELRIKDEKKNALKELDSKKRKHEANTSSVSKLALDLEANMRKLASLEEEANRTSFANMTKEQIIKAKSDARKAVKGINKFISQLRDSIDSIKSDIANSAKERDQSIVNYYNKTKDDSYKVRYEKAKENLKKDNYSEYAENLVSREITSAANSATSDIIDRAISDSSAIRLSGDVEAVTPKEKPKTAEQLKERKFLRVKDADDEASVTNAAKNAVKSAKIIQQSITPLLDSLSKLRGLKLSEGLSESEISNLEEVKALEKAIGEKKDKISDAYERFENAYESIAAQRTRSGLVQGGARQMYDFLMGKTPEFINNIESLDQKKFSGLKITKPVSRQAERTFSSIVGLSGISKPGFAKWSRLQVTVENFAKSMGISTKDSPALIISTNKIKGISDSKFNDLVNTIYAIKDKTIEALISQGNYSIDDIINYEYDLGKGINEVIEELQYARKTGVIPSGGISIDGYRQIIIYGGSTEAAAFNTFSHEIGHAIQNVHYENASKQTKEAIHNEFNKWLEEKSEEISNIVKEASKKEEGELRKDIIDMFKSISSPMTATKDISNISDLLEKMDRGEIAPQEVNNVIQAIIDYRLEFNEWFAEQTAKWATETSKPTGIVQKFFYELFSKLLEVYSMFMDDPKFNYKKGKEINKFLDDVFSRNTSISNVAEGKINSAFQRQMPNNNPPSASNLNQNNRQPLLDGIRAAIEGKFNTLSEYNKIIKGVNEKLKNSGLDQLSKSEREEILKNTESGIVSRIDGIIVAEGQKRPSLNIGAVRKSLEASASERDAAIKERNELIERMNDPDGDPLTQEELDRLDTLFLVGIRNASFEDKQQGLNVAKRIAKDNSKAVNNSMANAMDKRALTESELTMESILGVKPDANGEYNITIGRRTFNFRLHDNSKEYSQGDTVYRRGKIYEAINDIEAGTVFKSNNWKKVGSVSIPYTRAEYIKNFRQKSLGNRILQTLLKWELPLDGMLSYLDKLSINDKQSGSFKSKIVEYASRELIGAEISKSKMVSDTYQRAIDGINKLKGGKGWMDAAKVMNDYRTEEVEIKFKDNNGANVSVVMTKAELMYKYALLQDPNARPTFEAMKNNSSYDVATDKGWNDSKEQAILDAVDDDMKSIIDVFKNEVFPPVFEAINKSHRDHFGIDLVKEENYIPWRRYVDNNNSIEGYFLFDGTGDAKNMVKAVTSPSVKVRTNTTAPFQSSDFFEVAFQYSENAAHYATHLSPVSVLSNIIQRGDVSSYLSSTMGKEYIEAGDKLIANIAAGKPVGYKRIQAFDLARKGLILGSLGGNLTLIPKQLASFPAYANSMKGMRWAGMMATAPVRLANGTLLDSYRNMLKTDFIRNRMQKSLAANPDMVDMALGNIESSIGKNKTLGRLGREVAFKKVVDALMLPTKFGDIGAILIGGEPLYTATYQDAINSGMSEAEARKEAEFKLAEATSRTQQSDFMMDRGAIQTSGSLYSLLVTFMSTPILYGRMTSAALRSLFYGKGSAKQNIAQAALFTYVLPSLFFMVSAGSAGIVFGDDEDERYQDDDAGDTLQRNAFVATMGMIQHIPIVYPLVQNMMDNAFFGNKFRASAIPTITRMEKGAEALGNAVGKVKNNDKIESEDILKIAKEAAMLSGVNVKSVENLLENWSDLHNGEAPTDDSVQKMFLAMGFSQEALGLREYGAKSSTGKPVKGREVKKSQGQRRLESRKRKIERLKRQ